MNSVRFPDFLQQRYLRRYDSSMKGGATMELSGKKLEQLQRQPILETHIWKSEDGEWVVHETRIVDIKHKSYFEKVMDSQ